MSVIKAPRLLLAGTAAAASIGTAHAQSTGTAAGTTISNTAQASYTVNGTAQTAQSNTASFVVDRKVNLTVITDQSANTSVNVGQAGVVTRFKVTNNTNGTQDFGLLATQAISAGLLPGTDNFDLNNFRVYVDANGNGTYDPGVDTATYIDELAADASVEVFIVGDVPATGSPNLAFVGLEVRAEAGGAPGSEGAILIPTPLNTINQDSEVDIVFADNDNDGLGPDLARNGRGWAYAAYELGARTINLNFTKTATVLSDGVSVLNPKALPGAVVQYCLTVTNSTLTVPASGVTLTDIVPASTTYVAGSITVGFSGGLTGCVLSGYQQNDDGSNTTGPYGGRFDAATKTVSATIPTLAGGAAVAASFRVTVN